MTAASPGRTGDHQIAAEQAALRRVATLIAEGAAPEEVFSAVAAEVGRLLAAEFAILCRYDDPPDELSIAGTWTRTGAPAPTPAGVRLPPGGRNVTTLVYQTGRPSRIDYDDVSGVIGAVATRDRGLRSAVGVPIGVEGRLWGVMVVGFTHEPFLPADTEARLAGFTELAATAIANAQAQVERRAFADEQVALRRVATLVAVGTPPEEVFAAVAAEIGRVLQADFTGMWRYDADGAHTLVAAWSSTGTAGPVPAGSRAGAGQPDVTAKVFETGRPARVDDYAAAPGAPAGDARKLGARSTVGAPITVAGRLWGVMFAASAAAERLPADAEEHLAGFTELAATAIASAQLRQELRGLAEEQAALRRVAVLVARAAPPQEVLAAITDEAGPLLKADSAVLSRYDADGLATVVGHWTSTEPGRPLAVGLRRKPEGRNIPALVLETGHPARMDDHGTASGPFAGIAFDGQFRASAGVPIRVEGRLWGVMSVASDSGPLPPDTEGRLAAFTDLAATAIANAEAQAALTASRARIVATADQTRRRIERNLHDGAQQRLISLALQLRQAQAAAPPEDAELAGRLDGMVAEAAGVLEDLREIALGLHPAILTESGLRTALHALAHRSTVPVRLDVRVAGRLPEPVEIAAYYAVAEALANTARHAKAATAEVEAAAGDGMLRVRISDDGRGGAEFGHGSGLAGLKDRVEALSGRIWLDSPRGSGTAVHIVLPLAPASQQRRAELPARPRCPVCAVDSRRTADVACFRGSGCPAGPSPAGVLGRNGPSASR